MNERVLAVVENLKKRTVEEYLVALLVLLALLAAVQGLRLVAAGFQTSALQRSIALIGEAPPPRAKAPDAKKYEIILTKGMLGQPPQEGPASGIRIFGILGNKALMGPAPEGIQPYEAGAMLPGDEKLVSVGTDSVTLEKDGKQRTLKVFDPNKPPEPPGKPEENKGEKKSDEKKPDEPKPEGNPPGGGPQPMGMQAAPGKPEEPKPVEAAEGGGAAQGSVQGRIIVRMGP